MSHDYLGPLESSVWDRVESTVLPKHNPGQDTLAVMCPPCVIWATHIAVVCVRACVRPRVCVCVRDRGWIACRYCTYKMCRTLAGAVWVERSVCFVCVCVWISSPWRLMARTHTHTHTLCQWRLTLWSSRRTTQLQAWQTQRENERKKKEKAPLVVHRRQSPSVFFTVCLQLVSESEDLRLQSEGTVCSPPPEPGKHCDSAALQT